MPSRRCSGGSDRPGPSTRVPPISIVPASGRSRPAIVRSRVVFPQPEGPSRASVSAAPEVQVDAVEGDDRTERLPEPADADDGAGPGRVASGPGRVASGHGRVASGHGRVASGHGRPSARSSRATLASESPTSRRALGAARA